MGIDLEQARNFRYGSAARAGTRTRGWNQAWQWTFTLECPLSPGSLLDLQCVIRFTSQREKSGAAAVLHLSGPAALLPVAAASSNRSLQLEGLSDKAGNRGHFLIDMCCERFADKEK